MSIAEWITSTTVTERKKFCTQLQCWLSPYTQNVYERVMNQIEDIINNDTALQMISELYTRTQYETNEEINQIFYNMDNPDDYKDEIHKHVLYHSEAYRDVLYDMYIRH